MVPRRLGFFLDKLAAIEDTSLFSGLCKDLTGVHNAVKLLYWHHPIDVTFRLLYVEFSYGLSISVWRERAALFKK